MNVLQRNGRIQNANLAREVGLSPSPCLRRVRQLEEAGIIKRYAAILDGSKIDAGLMLFARIWFKAQDSKTICDFVAAINNMPEIVECYLMAGDSDAMVRIVTKDLAAYQRFHADHLTQIPSIQSIKTDVPMETLKETNTLPI